MWLSLLFVPLIILPSASLASTYYLLSDSNSLLEEIEKDDRYILFFFCFFLFFCFFFSCLSVRLSLTLIALICAIDNSSISLTGHPHPPTDGRLHMFYRLQHSYGSGGHTWSLSWHRWALRQKLKGLHQVHGRERDWRRGNVQYAWCSFSFTNTAIDEALEVICSVLEKDRKHMTEQSYLSRTLWSSSTLCWPKLMSRSGVNK